MLIILLILGFAVAGICLLILLQQRHQRTQLENQLAQYLQAPIAQQTQQLLGALSNQQLKTLQALQDGLQKGRQETSQQVQNALEQTRRDLTERVEKLTQMTENKLRDISGQVDKRLNEGFEKTNKTFADIVKRLALIDQAQQKISELSGNVVSLKELLNDKRSRGAFGEVQLSALIRNVLPEAHFDFQATLSNEKRADCILYLPEPTGNIVIDSKFPLENFQKMMDESGDALMRKTAQQQFPRDIKKHIQDIADKYIIPGETTDGAIMFIPAEAVFAEIHAHYPEIVETSHKAKVWLASPTTMMAILTTVRAVIRDDATRQQVHVIQEHLHALGEDFSRFQKRMDGLQRHIEQANDDVRQVNISARKITTRFNKIEKVDLAQEDAPKVLSEPAED